MTNALEDELIARVQAYLDQANAARVERSIIGLQGPGLSMCDLEALLSTLSTLTSERERADRAEGERDEARELAQCFSQVEIYTTMKARAEAAEARVREMEGQLRDCEGAWSDDRDGWCRTQGVLNAAEAENASLKSLVEVKDRALEESATAHAKTLRAWMYSPFPAEAQTLGNMSPPQGPLAEATDAIIATRSTLQTQVKS